MLKYINSITSPSWEAAMVRYFIGALVNKG
jgi:hypothetical protein